MEDLHSSENIIETQTTPAPDYAEFDPDTAKKLVEEAERIKKNRMVGAKVLSVVGFNNRHQEIIDSSYKKAREAKQKLIGNNGERRSDAYITRIENIINRHGAAAEQRLWNMSSTSSELIIKPENVPDSYWETLAQERRNNGEDDYDKESEVKKAQKLQRESIKSWSDYLSQKDCPYPMWFKLFAWDGVTKMSAVYDKDSQRFAKRDKTTVAPYPHLNPAILAQIYGAICKANELDESDEMEEPSLDEEAEKVTKTYNFNKLYSLFYSRRIVTPEVPKNPEDIHGDWVEYHPGDEESLAEAATGTPWCIATPAVGKHYLLKGEYGTDEIGKTSESKAKFILFHLRNEDTGELAGSACASIRLDTDGNVAEISGIQDDQLLHDSLVPFVERKVMSLPGGGKYREAFADKHVLIQIDKKMQNGEELTDDELRFIYELDHPIHKIEQYGVDTRIEEAKQKYPISVLIDRKFTDVRDLKQLMKKEQVDDITPFIDAGVSIKSFVKNGLIDVQDIDELLKRDVSHKDIIDIFEQGKWLFENFDYLASRGFTAREVAKQMSTSTLLNHLDFLDKNNVPYNLKRMIHKAIKQYDGGDVLDNSEAIMARGGKINFEKIAKKMDPPEIIQHTSSFCNNGHKAIVEKAIRELKSSEEPNSYNFTMSNNLKALLDGGIEIANLEEIANSPNRNTEQVLLNLDKLLERGVDVKIEIPELVDAFTGGEKGIFDAIVKHQELFNLQAVYEKMPKWAIVRYCDELIENGIKIDVAQLAKEAGADDRLLLKEKFEKYGVKIDVDSEINKLSSGEAFYLLDYHLDDETAPVVHENVDKIAALVLSGIKNDKQLNNMAKPLLWRLGYIK
ncbi:hypothetical protein IKX73_02375 [Candidatus Saccharibacteria bacterium]|nr:hypothetical protein [Candidatus Saccharibacteria bacterium]